MFRSMQRPGRDSQARWRGIGEPGSRLATPERSRPTTRARRRNQRLNCEALEGRQMLSGFYLINMESGLALDDTNFSTSNGNLIQQWQPTGGANQRWNLVSLPDGNDEIVNAYSGKVLDDTNWSTSQRHPDPAVAGHRRAQPAMEDRRPARRQRRDRQRLQRQGTRRYQLLHQQRQHHPTVAGDRRDQPAVDAAGGR